MSAIGAAHAQQTVSGPSPSGQVSWTSTDLLIDSTGLINGTPTGVITGAASLGTLTNQGTIDATNIGVLNIAGNTIARIANETLSLIHGAAKSGIQNNGVIGSISNSGTISGTFGIYNDGSISSLSNDANAIITGTNSGIKNIGFIDTIINGGTISSSQLGIYNSATGSTIGTINSIINQAGGLISGGSHSSGIKNESSIGTISNSGTITGSWGIYNKGSIGNVTNNANSLIEGASAGIQNQGGTITSLLNNGTINGGSVSSTTTVAGIANTSGLISTLTNSGVISGYDGIVNGGTLANNNTNIGTIVTLNNTINGVISGVRSGVTNSTIGTIGLLDNAGSITAGTVTNNAGINNAGLITTLDNSGSISGYYGIHNLGTGSIGLLSNSGVISGNSTAINNNGNIGTLSNSGRLSGTSTGISNGGHIGTLSNSGTINGGNHGIVNGGTIDYLSNSGVISGNNGISNDGTISTLNNTGLITGSSAALVLSNGTLTNFTNAGTIAGSIVNSSSNALTILGGSGTIFGKLTGSSGGIGAADIGNITTGGNLTFGTGNQLLNDNIDVGANTVTNSGVLQLNNPVTITGNYVQDAGATLLIGVSSGATFSTGMTDTGYGRLVVNGDAVIASGSAITLKSQGYSFAQGQRYVVVAANGSGTNYHASTLVYSATGYTVTASVQADSGTPSYSDLVLTLGAVGGSSSSGSGDSSSTKPINNATTSNASSALAGLFKYEGTNAALQAVFNPAAALDTAGANKAGAQLSPSAITGGAAKAVDAATQAVSNVVASHLDGFHLAQNGSSGVATGERSADIALWGQLFGGRAAQGLRENISGYHANYRGLLIGADGLVTDQIRAGGLFSAAKTSVASDGDNTGSSAEVNNYGLTAYATYTGTPWYVNVLAGAMRQEYSTVRTISYTGFSGVADGSFHGSQYVSSVQAGYPLNLDAWLPGATLTPIAGLSYSTLRQNGYTETGGNGAALSVNASSSNSLKSELGAKLENTYTVSYGKLLPSVQLGWRHEYRDSATQTGAIFAADSTGATAFVTRSTTPVANLGVLNLGVTLIQSNNLSLTGKYTLETGGGYTAQTGSVQVRWQY